MRKLLTATVLLMLSFIFIDFSVDSHSQYCTYLNKYSGFRFYVLDTLGIKSNFPGSTKAESCKLAFYRGVYEGNKIIPGYERLDTVCKKINANSGYRLWDVCYFNLGISVLYYRNNENVNNQNLVLDTESGIRFCGGTSNKLSCIAGVFTGINWFLTDNPKYKPIQENPVWICQSLKYPDYKLQCMRNLISYLYSYSGGNLEKSLLIIEQNSSNIFEKYEASHTLFSSLAFTDDFTEEAVKKICVDYKERWLKMACVSGYANGITETAVIGTEAKRILNYCGSNIFSFEDKAECYRRAFSEIPGFDKKANCLVNVPENFKHVCRLVEEVVPVPQ